MPGTIAGEACVGRGSAGRASMTGVAEGPGVAEELATVWTAPAVETPEGPVAAALAAEPGSTSMMTVKGMPPCSWESARRMASR